MPYNGKTLFRAYDSFTGEMFPAHRIYAVAYEPIWQSVRRKCTFSSSADLATTLVRLEAYTQMSKGYEMRCRLWRVWNLLVAVPHSAANKKGIHVFSRQDVELLLAQRESYYRLVQRLGAPTEWDWHESRRALYAVWRNDPELVVAMNAEHAKRANRGVKRELQYYMKLIAEVVNAQN